MVRFMSLLPEVDNYMAVTTKYNSTFYVMNIIIIIYWAPFNWSGFVDTDESYKLNSRKILVEIFASGTVKPWWNKKGELDHPIFN